MSLVRARGPRAIGPVPEGLSEDLRAFLERLKIAADATLDGTVARAQIASGVIAAGGGDGTGGGSETDLTPPPTPFGVTVTAGVDFVGIITGNPTFTIGNGYDRTIVYGAKYPGTGPLPTFASAAVVHEFRGEVGSFAAEPVVQWHIWVSWRSRDGVISTSPIGGVNGFQVTTGQVTDAMVQELNASKIRAGSLSVGEYIQSSGFVPLTTAGFRIDGNGGFEARTVAGARIFHLNASGAQPVLKIDSAFQITGAGALTMSGALTASTFTGGTITGSVIQTDVSPNKRVIINEASSNEARFYGNRGDGTNVLLASIGLTTVGPDTVIGLFGSTHSSNAKNAVAGYSYQATGIYGESNQSPGVHGNSTSGRGVLGVSISNTGVDGTSGTGSGVLGSTASNAAAPGAAGVFGQSTGSAPAVIGFAGSGSGHGGYLTGNVTRSALFLTPITAPPSNTTTGGVCFLLTATWGHQLCIAKGGAWYIAGIDNLLWDDAGGGGGV